MKTLLVYMNPKNKLQIEHFAKIKSILNKHKVDFKPILRDNITQKDTKNIDFILALGGDGTFLRTAHKVKTKTPIFGINLDTTYKIGHLLQSTVKDFEKDLKKILAKKFKTIEIQRLQAKLNGKILPHFALNEFFIGFKNAYYTARYEITIDGKTEFQKSSGILVGGAAGSTGWIKSAGGKEFPITSDKFQMIIREPYCSRTTQCTIRKKIFNKDYKLKIRSEMNSGIIVADSLNPEYKFNKGHVVEISMSKHPIHYVKL